MKTLARTFHEFTAWCDCDHFRIWAFGFLSSIDDFGLTIQISPFIVGVLKSFSANFQSRIRNSQSPIRNRTSGSMPISWVLRQQ